MMEIPFKMVVKLCLSDNNKHSFKVFLSLCPVGLSLLNQSSGLAKTILQGTVSLLVQQRQSCRAQLKENEKEKEADRRRDGKTISDFASSTGTAENRQRWRGVVAKIYL